MTPVGTWPELASISETSSQIQAADLHPAHDQLVPMQITTIGLDIFKNVFQVHGIDAAEKVVVRKQLRRGQMLAFFKALPP